MIRKVLVALLIAAMPACGADEDPPVDQRCALDNPKYYDVPGCLSGLRLAMRYTNEVLLQQAEWDEYYRIIAAVYRVSPLTQLATPSGVGVQQEVTVTTPVEPIIDAWMEARLETGDLGVDAIFAANAESVRFVSLTADGTRHVFTVRFPTLASVDELAERLAALDLVGTDVNGAGQEEPFLYRPYNDTTVEWAGDLAQVSLIGGWGDCFSGCRWYHSWSATVTGDDTVEVSDLGGDPIPDEILDQFGLPH